MHCSEFHHRLDALLDDRENPAADPRLAAHAADCEGCRQYLSEQTALFAGLSRLKAPALDAAFARRVVALATAEIRPARTAWPLRRISWALGVALTSAAGMLMAISVVWYAHRPELTVADGNAAPARFTSGSRFPGFALLAPPYFGHKPVAPPAPTSKITIADVLLESPRLPSRLHGYRGALDELAIAERLEEFEQLSPAFRPLRASLTVIWDTLCRTITTTRSDSSPPPRDGTGYFLPKPLCVA
jgi:hypothetical protein